MRDPENMDLWIGHNLNPTNALDIGGAMVEAHSRYCLGLQLRDPGCIEQAARWLLSIHAACQTLLKEHEDYSNR